MVSDSDSVPDPVPVPDPVFLGSMWRECQRWVEERRGVPECFSFSLFVKIEFLLRGDTFFFLSFFT